MKKATQRLMKQLFSIIALSLISTIFISCEKEEEKIEERPGKILPTVVKAEVLEEIDSIFPERTNFLESHPELFDVSAEKNIVLKKESEVFLTFVSEGAKYENTLGYYIYTPSEGTVQKSNLNLQVLFPNVSDDILDQGDMLQVGDSKYPAGTVIGFFLIVRGWNSEKVDFNRETFYTNTNFNLEQQQQHVLFTFQEFNEIVLAFEDIFTSDGGDKDFNDIIFTISDNKEKSTISNFDLTNVKSY
ncbi:hypothetical protein GCM10011506_04110 [Marivirga lumbricoides]|uniref:DUF4114 domain-containing protein n=1 Tax=Marivirga lumbricoides TaxID=1046115 RepID=A0A2T4DSL5_9BACT|nr:hypothetical protein C9994_05845 [Marivirga lumbricoides]GGC22018.1 hypothetical protein GCM10011506_04110 [Marivirga lumbricoides]